MPLMRLRTWVTQGDDGVEVFHTIQTTELNAAEERVRIAQDLTGATVEGVIHRKGSDGPGFAYSVTLLDPTQLTEKGRIKHVLTAEELNSTWLSEVLEEDEEVTFVVEFHITFADGETRTWPNKKAHRPQIVVGSRLSTA